MNSDETLNRLLQAVDHATATGTCPNCGHPLEVTEEKTECYLDVTLACPFCGWMSGFGTNL